MRRRAVPNTDDRLGLLFAWVERGVVRLRTDVTHIPNESCSELAVRAAARACILGGH